MSEGFITDPNIAIDASHIEARDQAPTKKEEKQPKPKLKKCGRKSNTEREQWLKDKEAIEASLPIYQKKIEDQLDVSYNELHDEMPLDPEWGVKKNSDGKNMYWYGFKGHFAVDTESQFIIHSMFSSGNLNDGKAAIPLLKGIESIYTKLSIFFESSLSFQYLPYQNISNECRLYRNISNRRLR